MIPITDAVNQSLSILTLGAQVAIVVLAVAAFISRDIRASILEFFGTHASLLSFIVALSSMITSLFYSDIVGYEPCAFCWYQRIVMYPLVVIFGLAWWKRRDESDYGLIFSGIGLLIAGYQYLLQWGVVTASPCAATAVSCAKIFFMTFGYITLPLMAFTAFAMIFILQLMGRNAGKE